MGVFMASYFDGPKDNDDGAFIAIRFREILSENHPARYIKQFIDNIDISSFEKKYIVGEGMKGRAPKDIKMMLGVILYALYSRIFSARRIDYATYTYADFWIFTHKERISHDKISDFIIQHEEDMQEVFIETIKLAQKNNLLSFESLYQDGFLLKANASKRKNRNMKSLKKNEEKLSARLKELFEKLKDKQVDNEIEENVKKAQIELLKIKSLKNELNKKIKERSEDKANYKSKEIEEKLMINEIDPDSDLMKMKKGGYDNAYLKVCALDSKADIIMSSEVTGYYNEADKSVGLFDKANENSKNFGKYDKCVADSGFNTIRNCEAYDKKGVGFISPTKQYENEVRNPEKYNDKISFRYDQDQQCVYCSEGRKLDKKEKYYDKTKKSNIMCFWNVKGCENCKRIKDCTDSNLGYRKVKINELKIYQDKMLELYKSELGKNIYKKRSHTAETFQGDLSKNGRLFQLLRRGIEKVKLDSTMHDIVWNLRRIFNNRYAKC
jgi:hypothetical protein